MKIIKYIFFFLFSLVIFSCGSKKGLSNKRVISEDAAAASVIDQHYAKEIEFETMQARLEIHYEDESNAHNIKASLRMDKNDTIWLSGGLFGMSMAKVMITPKNVRYYEKLGSSYFDGDFELLSDWLGLPLDYEKVQNLLLGQSLFDLREEQYVSQESQAGYQLAPAVEQENLTRLFLFDPTNYKIKAEQFAQPQDARNVTISYPEYQKAEGRIIPEKLEIRSNSPEGSSYISIEYDDVEFNRTLNFPFSIPEGYDEITIE